jgi:hypothetical protein
LPLSAQMPESGRRYAWPVAVLLAAFVAGLAALLMLRFESGDVYPPYSSLRSDPLGTRALFESLNTLAPDTARRWHRPPDQMNLGPQTTLLFCGLSINITELRGRNGKRLMDRLAIEGGRIVITLSDRALSKNPDEEEQADPCDDTPAGHQADDEEEEAVEDVWDAAEKLGIAIALARRSGSEPMARLAAATPSAGLPATVPWHGAQYFQVEDEAWRSIYFIDQTDRPVIVRRAWGRGELVLAADSFPLSNEALSRERATPLLSWFLPPGQRIVFDEFHHGIAHRPGIATLARKYGLEKILGALIFIGLLFVWRQSSVFVPPVAPHPPADETQAIAGGDSGQGLVSLMQRHISQQQLLSICFSTWQAGPAARQVSGERLAKARQWLAMQTVDRHDPVTAYRHIVQLLEQRKHL